MSEQAATIERVAHFWCPCGEKRWTYEHLGKSRGGPWYCDGCGVGWLVRVVDGAPMIEDRGHRKAVVPVMLRMSPPEGEEVWVEVEHSLYSEDGVLPTAADYDADSARFLYEEHQCPGNIFRSVEKVLVGKDDDQHGLFDLMGMGTTEVEADQPKRLTRD